MSQNLKYIQRTKTKAGTFNEGIRSKLYGIKPAL